MVIRSTFLILLMLSQQLPTISAETSHDFARWQPAIDAFVADDKENPTKPGGVVFVGSSSIRMWDLEKSFPAEACLNRGFGGSQIADSVHYFKELISKHKPRLVVFYAGDNDMAQGNSPEQVLADFRAFVDKLQKEVPDARLAYIAIKPSIARWGLAEKMKAANALIAADCAEDDQLVFIDVWSAMLGDNGQPRPDNFLKDGLHLNEKGYELWTELLRPQVTQ